MEKTYKDTCEVPVEWLQHLLKFTEQANDSINNLDFKQKSEIIPLIGFARSAYSIIIYNKIPRKKLPLYRRFINYLTTKNEKDD